MDTSQPSGGSSPRVRGTRYLCQNRPADSRFIPACAGNTLRENEHEYLLSVHPRVCGEHLKKNGRFGNVAGSSPRVRGTHFLEPSHPSFARFIPACAGNTSTARRDTCPTSVHPRVCGEHSIDPHGVSPHRGSSPRVRGTLGQVTDDRIVIRFIPACAGNTVS